MLGEPKSMQSEAEGDFLQRRSRFFFLLSGIAGLLCVATAFATRSVLPVLDMKLFLFGVLTMMFGAVCLVSLAGAIRSRIESLSHPRVQSIGMDRLIYTLAIVLALVFGASMMYLAIDGLVTGEVAAKRGKISDDLLLPYVLFESLWFLGAAAAFREAFKLRRQMSCDRLLAPNPAVNRTCAKSRAGRLP